jgi:hypothetical protein
MPFNGQNQVRARLEILRELCETNVDRPQNDWRSCLWSEARRDKRLRQLGLGVPHAVDAAEFFGLDYGEGAAVFGARPKLDKLLVILAALARLDGSNPKPPGALAFVVLNRVRCYFGNDGEHWLQDEFRHGKARCLVSALASVRGRHHISGDRSGYYIRRAIVEVSRGMHGRKLEADMSEIIQLPQELWGVRDIPLMRFNDACVGYDMMREVLAVASELALRHMRGLLQPLPRRPRRKGTPRHKVKAWVRKCINERPEGADELGEAIRAVEGAFRADGSPARVDSVA